ncbi:YadA-like family protein [Lonepinella sp. MS14437]|uniref:YadA-like family protein n=1 Tax=Lonepinella sp. MS14437 TaxID=3003620 RepID=UPI0036D8964F
MNKIYKVIWSKVTRSFVVVSELASSQGKAKSSVVNQQSKLSSLLSICFQLSAVAIPLFSTIQTASAVVAIGGMCGTSPTQSTATANATRGNIAYNYANPGNMHYYNQTNTTIYSGNLKASFGIAIGDNATTIGSDNYSSGVAIGDYARATGGLSFALGAYSQATASGATVIGTASLASGFNSLAMMRQAAATANYSMAIGTASWANGTGSLAMGASATSQGEQSIAIGSTDSIGANGQAVTQYDGTNNTKAIGNRSIALGVKTKTQNDDTIAIGTNNTANGNRSIVMGINSSSNAQDSIIIGTNGNTTGKNSGTIGGSTTVNANTSYSLGNSNTIKAGADNSFVVGNNVTATNANSVILGNGSSGTATVNSSSSATINTIAYSSFAGVGSQTKGYVSVGSSGNERQIKNVAAGEISATSTDAINGSQLYVVADTLSKKIPTVVAGNNTNIASTTSTTGTKGPVYTVNAYNTTAKAGSTSVNVTEKVNGYNISYEIDLSQTTKTTIETANTTAHAANATANKANTTANLANTTANTANGTANTANNTANTANNTANTANNTANTANKTADLANTTANTANTTVNKGWNITTSQSSGSVSGNESKNVQMGETVTIDAGQNINITQSDKKISIATSMTPTFTSATFGGTTINNDGLTITNGPSVTTSGINAGNKTITNLANGVNNSDAVNKGQLEVVNTTANAANTTANTANGTANTANTTANAANTTANTANGTANTANTTANTANTTANIANATVNKGWNITTSASDGSATNTTDENVQMGENVTIDAGQNINITQNGQNISIATSMTPTFTSATFGGTTINSDGLTITNGPSVTTSGINAGNKTITNLANGVNNSDAVNKGQLEVVNTTANAANTTANTANGTANTANTTANTANTTANTANGTANTANTTANTANTTANAANTTANIANATVNKGWNITTSASDGSATNTTDENVQMGENVTIDAGQNINITQNGQKISIATSMTPTFTSAKFGDTLIQNDGLTIVGGPSITKSGINAGSKTITNVATGVNTTDAVNKGQLDAVNTTATTANNTANAANTTANAANTTANAANTTVNKGWNITTSASTGGSVSGNNAQNIQMGDTVTIDAGQNINITQSGQNISIATSMTPTFTNATFGDTLINSDGLTITAGPSITKSGVNAGNKNITNVATPIAGTDAANKDYVDNFTLTYKGDNSSTGSNKLTETVTFAGTDKQIVTTAENGKVSFKLADEVNASLSKADSALQSFTVGADNKGTNATINNTSTHFDIVGTPNYVNTTVNGQNITVDIAQSFKDTVTNNTQNISNNAQNITNNANNITNNTNNITNNTNNITKNTGDIANNTQNITKNATEIAKGFGLKAQDGQEITKALGEKVEVIGGNDNINTSVANGKIQVNLNNTLNLTNAGSVTVGNSTINDNGLNITNGTTTVSLTEKGLDNGNQTITHVANGTNGTDAVNKNQLDAVNATANAGWNFNTSGNATKTNVAPNNTVTFNGDKNVNVTHNGSTLNVSLNNTVDLGTSGSLKVNGTTINSNGTISGVTNGTLNATSTEAVNGSQLFATNQNVTTNTDNIAKNTATIDKGMVYGGDTGNAFTLKLGDQANVKGGITDTAALTDNNLGVVSDGSNTLMVKLAKELTNLTSATFGSDTDKTVINKDGVTITNGTDTISLTENGLDNGNKTITNVANGTNSTDAVNKSQLDAVTTTANAGWKLQANGTNESTVAPNDTVSLNNTDKNIVISKETTDDNVTFNLAKDLTGLTSATFGDTSINNDGLTIKDGPNVTKSGIDAANTKITNVTNGTVDATSKDAVNGSQLYATNQNISNVSSNVSNNTAEIAKGWNLTTSANGGAVSGNTTEQINMGETISFIAGKNVNLTQATNNITIATADNVTFTNVTLGDTTKTTDGLVTLTKEGLTVTNGTSTVNLTTNGLDNGNQTITHVANGTNGTDAVNFDQLKAVNATANAGWNFNTSGNVTKTNVAPNNTVTFNGDSNINVTHNGSTLNVSLNNTVDLGTSGSLKVNSTTINNNGTISGVTNGTLNATSTEAVNGSQLFATNQNVTNNANEIAKGTVYGGDTGTSFTRQLGEQTNVKGGITDESKLSDNNLGVVSDNTNNTLMVKLAKELTNLTSATFGNDTTDKTVINKDGVTITNGTDTISLTENGLDNGNKTITNVKAGVNDTDAVNKAQLDAVTTTANAGWKLQANGTNESTVTPNETVSLNNTDNNIVISKDSSNDNVTFNLAKNLTDLTSAAFGGTSINNDGLTIKDGPNVTKSGIDAANTKITNVTDGAVDANSKDAVNGSQLYATNQNISNVSSNVSNNTAEIAKGWNLTTSANGGAVSGNSTEQINMGETISFIAGKNVNLTQATNNITIATADNVTFTNVTLGDTTKTTDGLVTLTKEGLTVTNGTSTVNLTTSGLDNGNQTITHVANGTNGTDAVNFDQLKAVNATANAGWNFNTSGNVTKTNVAPNNTVTFNGDSNINVTHNGSTLNVSLNNTVDLGTSGSLKVNSTTINSNGTISGVTNGTLNATSTEAVNGSQLFATNQNVTNNTQNIANNTATINKGTVYGGDIGTNFTRKLGEQTNVKGGITDESKLSDNNLGVVSDNTNNTLMVKLAKDLNLTSDGSVTMGDTLLNSTGLTITNGPSVTNNGIQAGNKQITNVSSGLGGTALKDASGDTLKNVANIGDLQTVINNVTNASAGGGFGLTDDKGDKVTQDLGKTIALNGKDGITVTANTASDGLEIGLGNNVTIGSKDGVAGIVNVKDKDGDDTITLDAGNSTVNIGSNGAAGSIGLNGLDGTVGINGKDGTNASITVANGTKGIDGNDLASGANKTRIVYENANGSSEQVATLNDGLYFTGDNTTVNISKKLNETLTIKGNLSQTANVTDQNLRVDVVDNALVIKMAKELTNLTNATFGSGTDKTVIDKDGVTITNGTNTVSLTEKGLNNGNNTITNVSSGLVNNTDGSNVTLANATGDTLTNVVNVGDLKNSIHNITNASAGGGFGLTDDKGDKVTQDLGKTIALNGKDGITVTANATLGGLEVGLGNNVTIGGKDGTSGVVNVKDKDGDNAITLDAENATVSIGSDGLPGSIGLDGTNGTIGIIGKDGTNASITVTDGAKGLAGNDGLNGASKTRITYTKSDGTPEEVATLNDGLFFTGDDTNVTVGKKLNETLTIKGNLSQTANVTDQNLRVDVVDNALVIKMAKELQYLTNATFISGNSQSVIDGNGFTITSNVAGKNPVSLTDNGLNNGNNTITHVANGTNGTDAVNKNQLDAVNATANAGWNFNTSGNATTTNVAPNSTVTFNGDKNINVTHDGSNLNVSLNNTVDLGANGSMKIGNTTVDNNGLTVGNTTVTDNGLTIAGGPSVTQAGIDAGNKKLTGVLAGDISATSTDAINGAQIYQVEQNVKAAKTEVEAGNNVNVSTTTGKNGQTIYTVATASDVDFDKVTVGDVTISKNSGINAGNHQVANVANGSISADSKDAVNGSQLYATNQNVTNLGQEVAKGWNVTTSKVDGSTGTVTGNSTTKVAMGDTVSVKAGNNIAITQDGKNIAIATSMTPTFDSVTVGTKGNSAKIGTTTDNYGNAISVTGDDGVSPTRITNVAAGQADNDAVNVSQVRNMANHINSSINKVDKNLRAGIAGAMAAGNLYHVTLPGKSMVAAGAGVYKGEGAVAVGYSRLSDNGKIGIKFSVNSNTRGDTGAAASVGYQW